MPKGHRRTQSSNLVLSVGDGSMGQVKGQVAVASHQIVILLAKSTDKIQQKVSSVDVLHSQSMPQNTFFQFGKGSNRNSQIGRTRSPDEEYMLGMPRVSQSAKMSQNSQNFSTSARPFGKKEKTGIGVTQAQGKMVRTPFNSTLNYAPHSRRGLQFRDSGVRRGLRGEEKRQ